MSSALTYISLFSGAGVGCYGFLQEDFECIATVELKNRRLAVQRYNNKCKYLSGYICGDISSPAIKEQLLSELYLWRFTEHISDVDVVIATPPCQGMSVANQKKTKDEIVRNSLVVESLQLIAEIKPKIFIIENVPQFMKTPCKDTDGAVRLIGDAIDKNLGSMYSIYPQVINFKDYGACSSRRRALILGVRKDLADFISPLELFPAYQTESSLQKTIGHMKSLKELGEIDPCDIYHSFRYYPPHMRAWISELKQGQSAFDNPDTKRIPHKEMNGQIIYNQRKNGDKYRRQIWDKVGPCVHTRNDQLASQNTIHPVDDRVFSIRELMIMMTVPFDFNWSDIPFSVLNTISDSEKQQFLKAEEANIRKSLGEAVPTVIFRSIATNIRSFMSKTYLNDTEIKQEISEKDLTDVSSLLVFIQKNPKNLGFTSLSRIAELANSKRTENNAYFTNKSLITEMVKTLPPIDRDSISVLEPSVGTGSFLPILCKLYEHKVKVTITVVDIDYDTITILKELVQYINLPVNTHIEYICCDFLSNLVYGHFDLVIGNPPFSKSATGKLLKNYRACSVNKKALNTSAFFIEKALSLGDYISLIMPKFLLNTPEYQQTRDLLCKYRIDTIIDFGEHGFSGVLIETVALSINTKARPTNTQVHCTTKNQHHLKPQKYICDSKFPYWLIYRDTVFDKVCEKLQFDVFYVFRDRQITNALLSDAGIRVIKSRNIAQDGSGIIDIDGYDAYITPQTAKELAVYKYLMNSDVYLAPNMTYKPRVIRKPKGVLTNGSTAILSLKENQPPLCDEELKYFATSEYREFYSTARNRQTRSLNIDEYSIFFFGRLKIKRDENI